MSNESITPEEAARAIEYPDKVSFKPDNPFLANFRPYIPAGVHLRELTPLPLIMGTLLGMVFGASSLYLVLKVGLTVSASIPVAVISITLFRVLSKVGLRDATILENNIVQTAGSAGESIALGVGFLYQVLMTGLKGWKDTPEKVFGAPFKAGSISAEISPALLGVGYIIGPRIASIMCAGGVLAYLVLIPAIKFFGSGMTTPLAPGTVPISEMSPSQIRGAYILYIGAGAVAAGGIISLFRSLPTIWHGLKGGLADLRGGSTASAGAPRTDQDMSMKVVIGGILVLIAMIMLFPQLNLRFNLIGAVLIVAFGFLFVTVSSRLTGEIGSSSNPISGMTVATLLLTCLIFLVIGWTGPSYYITALSIGGIVCIASSNGGTTSQDLKTGFLVGSTPKYQQIAILIGAFASALILGPILLVLNDSATVYVPRLSFEPATKSVMVDPGKVNGLPNFTDQIKPPAAGNYRVLKNDAAAPIVTGLDPGEYLIDGSGKVVYK